LICSST
jgi:predicted nuclease with TOPRIM domain